MITEIDYQAIVDLVGEMMKYAIPIGMVFGLSEKIVTLFFSMAFGNKRIKL